MQIHDFPKSSVADDVAILKRAVDQFGKAFPQHVWRGRANSWESRVALRSHHIPETEYKPLHGAMARQHNIGHYVQCSTHHALYDREPSAEEECSKLQAAGQWCL